MMSVVSPSLLSCLVASTSSMMRAWQRPAQQFPASAMPQQTLLPKREFRASPVARTDLVDPVYMAWKLRQLEAPQVEHPALKRFPGYVPLNYRIRSMPEVMVPDNWINKYDLL